MGSVSVTKIERAMGGKVETKIEVRAAGGRVEFPMTTDDFGSAGKNEQAALRDLQTFLEEALELVRRQIA